MRDLFTRLRYLESVPVPEDLAANIAAALREMDLRSGLTPDELDETEYEDAYTRIKERLELMRDNVA